MIDNSIKVGLLLSQVIIIKNNLWKVVNNEVSSSKADVILHPIRMRIIQALAGNSYTVQELLERIEDVPQATLYRHLNVLKKAQVIRVEKEQKIRGTVEKTYALEDGKAFINAQEAKEITPEDHLRYFISFYTNLVGLAEDYLKGDVDYAKDGFGYHQLELHLTDEEHQNFLNDYKELLMKYHLKARSDRRVRTMATAFIPEKTKKKGDQSEDK
ncbi:helix-turn-helix domain-containing protein [Priestia megaterium]|nr:helix-turn-helix domain-containing protein [Priestia megaterium]